MASLLKVLFITICGILAGVAAFCGAFSHPSTLANSTVLSWCVAIAVVGLIVFSIPAAIVISVAWKLHRTGSWRGRLLLCLCLGASGGAFASSILYGDSHDSFSYSFVLAGCIGGLVSAFLIIILKPHQT
jgi:hypothetical protein